MNENRWPIACEHMCKHTRTYTHTNTHAHTHTHTHAHAHTHTHTHAHAHAHAHTHTHTHRLQKENAALKEKLGSQEHEYHQAITKMHAHHEDRILKMREQYVDLTASLLNNIKDRDGAGGGGGGGAGGGASPKQK